MDYLFENLGDERFQEFCSTLIAKEFPDTQSFPVGQPDGGRDSLVFLMNNINKEFFVFQVKYVRNPNAVPDTHKWLTDIIDAEASKINNLIPRGARKFYLLTNVRGTAHLESGSKDKVNKILEEKISIPSLCWWRDDLSRLLEKDSLFRWSFPEILNGQDILNSILFQNINESKERRESILKAYLADQFSIDNEVKFRQIDLHNRLIDLFTDVPIKIKKLNDKDKSHRRIWAFFEKSFRNVMSHDELIYFEESENIGAASFLLHPKVQNDIERVLLEGGPGQGKSTISQYICQVHRVRLLNKKDDIDLIPNNILQSPIRLPFKIDLRHVALWVENKNPYQSRLNDESFKSIWRNSLESFIIGHVLYHSQCETFNTDDLNSILKHSSVLLVFDGFDEIADLKIRRDVIDFINKGINRIKENSKSIQIVITSRPAAFSDTIGFSVDEYPHFQLCDITLKTTKEYVDKWIKASRLDSREAAEIRRLVDEKLQLPHLRDLAKSPMQLAIFISLLRTRGESLPNKRTALYDSYIELFFNRESEKNITIRDHRDLIIDIHQYIAWILHSEAELYGNSGSIDINDLKQRLKIYLIKEGHQTDIADNLFHVLQERVCALVSRVQGTYEFEVQPLREYFCAKYLYNTSPYSPAGKEKTGTKPERFNAIAKNYYWHNVVRFFSGCFDKGELPMLIQELKELQNDSILRYTNYPSLITSQILSDWVFTQYPILMKDVIKIIVDGINIGSIINQDSRFTNNETILLPSGCGRKEIFDECFAQLRSFPKRDYANELIGIIKNNPLDIVKVWMNEVENYSDSNLVKWLEYAYLLQIIHKIDSEVLEDIVKNGSLANQVKKIQILVNGNRLDIIKNNTYIKNILLDGILNNTINVLPKRRLESSVQCLGMLLYPFLTLSVLRSDNVNEPFIYFIFNRFSNDQSKAYVLDFEIVDKIDLNIKKIIDELNPLFQEPIRDWKTTISYWDVLVEKIKNCYGDNWSIKIIAILAAGIKSKDEKFDEYIDLSDSTKSLCKRTRCARLKSGNSAYWINQFRSSEEIIFKLTVFFTWATPKTIINVYERVREIIVDLNVDELSLIVGVIKNTYNISVFTQAQSEEITRYLRKKSGDDLMKVIIGMRFSEKLRNDFICNNIHEISDCFEELLIEIKYEYSLNSYLKKTDDQRLLADVVKYYSSLKNYTFNDYIFDKRYYRDSSKEVPIDIAKKIMEEPKSYPRIIASIAEKSCRQYANSKIIPVGKIASNKKWFE